ncbi:hypothetical protein ACJ73_10111 [Blastomyces percursus]|uniref:Uncharacterized protein n=1 Tax=Blastomyces percursus TaxID=1658174 RepID=A0A1J9PPH1_9EURO|nr:hypothetical protein ACJ73_10111 [Blastomyces percursus]
MQEDITDSLKPTVKIPHIHLYCRPYHSTLHISKLVTPERSRTPEPAVPSTAESQDRPSGTG